MHPYREIPLFVAGLLLAVWLIGFHLLMLLKPEPTQRFFKRFPRNDVAGQILLAVGLAWFWLLIAPSNWGPLSYLTMNLGEFDKLKPLMQILVPVLIILVPMCVKDFLAVRALGLVGLMVASPLLESAFLKDPQSRLLVPIYAYALLTAAMFWVGMPYLFRNAVEWVTAKQSRWRGCAMAGLAYGVVTLICCLAFWRDY
ncbi:MAG: hypothetical protein MUF04_15105 [Akkermansiaceae bacterium]|jgi:hypothetical protein|nr:hypothetical protein [Akkermansiaceae bacterium]